MLVVLGILSLLIAILLPPLRIAHEQALETRCKMQEQQLGLALEAARYEFGFYPIWDDGGSPMRYTWIDVLVQRRLLGNARSAYCPGDPRPSMLNSSRGEHYQVYYPGQPGLFGIDYSYGIGVPLSAGGWIWRPGFGEDDKRRKFEDHDRYTSERILVADGHWSTIYNLSGDYLLGRHWSQPNWYDNTVAWRHRGHRANLLFQDGHVSSLNYQLASRSVDTMQAFVWYPGEKVNVGPPDQHGGNYYPDAPPLLSLTTGESAGDFPSEMAPGYYTDNMLWTQISNK